MKMAIDCWAEKDMAEIEARAAVCSAKYLNKQKVMLGNLKGKCYYAMIRNVDIPNSFSN
jgi:hypothetical protein